MRYLFYFGHPAHYHLFKHTIGILKERGHEVDILCKTKDLLEDLLRRSGWEYTNILPKGREDDRLSIALGLARRNLHMLSHCLRQRPGLMAGTSPEIAQIGRLLGIPSIVVNEDDVDVVPLFARAAYPFCTAIVAPGQTRLGKWEEKGVKYPGYQKLAYLHPNRFTPDQTRIAHLYGGREQYFLLRFVKLTAHHDRGIGGFTPEMARRVIDLLEPHGTVWISAEYPLEEEFCRHQLRIDPLDIHHALQFATLFVGDSQSMTVESAMLGTPSVRFSDLAGRISVLEELEHQYGLTFGVRSGSPERVLDVIGSLLSRSDLRHEWARRRAAMLQDKIDLTAFLVWLMEEYPQSLNSVRRDADYYTRSHTVTEPHLVAGG